ncbi:COP9 signalosome complex subunit 6 isoform X1 [Anopheles ziemanni]|uniref:COP9 signalosome complex subunit 6 isoform X1 n=1 Tax=Anopheles coustani TaxID=139045 RepID=UPI002658B449|nr:COP9 signalosome complex subunit 6 isoform X1 [Anopheles coustani]XP_058167486.1 COP9 signalosome complex subunit 6 isoform X1 [Anopheles ziemanni]
MSQPAEEKMDVDSDGVSATASTSSSSTLAAVPTVAPSTSKASASPTPSAVPAVAGNSGLGGKPAHEGKNVMASSATVPSVTCSLHPLVIMNISDHWTRTRAQSGNKPLALGALIGKQKGRNIEVMNSFELKYHTLDDDVIIMKDYYRVKEEQYKQVFSDLDFLGWYTTDARPTEKHISIHKQICEINECPIMLLLDPISRNMNQLPISLYESVIDIVQGEAMMLFVPLSYTLATEEAERIGVDHVARMSTNDSDENSTVAEHLLAQYSAIKMLNSRVKIVLAYMKAVESGQLEPNQEILRMAYSLSRRLPVVQNPSFKEEFYTQSNDVGLITYLGALTKVSNDMNQLVNKFNVLYDRQGMGRRLRGIFF